MLKQIILYLFLFVETFSIVSATLNFSWSYVSPHQWIYLDADEGYYTVSFGDLPREPYLISNVTLSVPLDACSPISLDNTSPPPILIAVKGNCEFHVKARNAEEAGVKLLLIANDEDRQPDGPMLVNSPGELKPPQITTLLISKKNGDELILKINEVKDWHTTLVGTYDSITKENLQLLAPSSLKDWWKANTNTIQYSISYFGDIPWQGSIQGKLTLSEPLDACSEIHLKESTALIPTVLVAVKGSCEPYIKARNAELAGVKLLLIVDTETDQVNNQTLLNPFYEEKPIHVPAVLISSTAGKKLIEEIKEVEEEESFVVAKYGFQVRMREDILQSQRWALLRNSDTYFRRDPTEKVYYSIQAMSGDRVFFDFVKDFRQYQDKFDDRAELTVTFPLMKPELVGEKDCICGRKYCAYRGEDSAFSSGAEIVLENLRQRCVIRQYDLKKWWQYVVEYRDFCVVTNNTTPECSERIFENIKVDSTNIQWCMKIHFDQPDMVSCTKNLLLDEESDYDTPGAPLSIILKERRYESGTTIGKEYRGNVFPAKGVFEAICQWFLVMPKACQDLFNGPEVSILPSRSETNNTSPNAIDLQAPQSPVENSDENNSEPIDSEFRPKATVVTTLDQGSDGTNSESTTSESELPPRGNIDRSEDISQDETSSELPSMIIESNAPRENDGSAFLVFLLVLCIAIFGLYAYSKYNKASKEPSVVEVEIMNTKLSPVGYDVLDDDVPREEKKDESLEQV